MSNVLWCFPVMTSLPTVVVKPHLGALVLAANKTVEGRISSRKYFDSVYVQVTGRASVLICRLQFLGAFINI